MERYRDAWVFFSGRLVSLVVLLGFQLLAVRLLEPLQYGRFALVFAWSLVAQIVLSFGVQRLIPKYFGQVGNGLRPRAAARLLWLCLLVRFVGSVVAIALVGAFWPPAAFTGPGGLAFFASTLCYIPLSMAQVDTDAIAQALGLQRASRAALLGECVVRFALTAAGAALGLLSMAWQLLAIGSATAGLSAALLLAAILRMLARVPEREGDIGLDWREVMSIAVGGYAGAMAWLCSSPPAVRIIASRCLATLAFAGFSFAQTLVLSFQRYTPATLMFPFVEPLVLRQHAQGGEVARMEATLSLLTKIDLLVIGGAIVGCIVAGEPLVALMTGGRYAQSAFVLPFVLAYVSSTSIYRTFEIVAVVLKVPSAMVWALLPSAITLGLAIWLSPRAGIAVVLAYPLLDAAARLALFRRALGRHGVRHVFDLPIAAAMLVIGAICALAGLFAARAAQAGPLQTVAIGVAAGMAYLIALVLLRPLRHRELGVLGLADSHIAALLSRFARP